MTYGVVANKAGNKKASRAVVSILAKNQDIAVPCRRVVKSGGSIGNYNGLLSVSKEEVLTQEGVRLCKHKVILSL